MAIEPMTLGTCRREGRVIVVTCRACDHRATIRPTDLPYRDDVAVRDVADLFRCAKCTGPRYAVTWRTEVPAE